MEWEWWILGFNEYTCHFIYFHNTKRRQTSKLSLRPGQMFWSRLNIRVYPTRKCGGSIMIFNLILPWSYPWSFRVVIKAPRSAETGSYFSIALHILPVVEVTRGSQEGRKHSPCWSCSVAWWPSCESTTQIRRLHDAYQKHCYCISGQAGG